MYGTILSMSSLYTSSANFLNNSVTTSFRSSLFSKRFPLKNVFNLRKNRKSHLAKSRLYVYGKVNKVVVWVWDEYYREKRWHWTTFQNIYSVWRVRDLEASDNLSQILLFDLLLWNTSLGLSLIHTSFGSQILSP